MQILNLRRTTFSKTFFITDFIQFHKFKNVFFAKNRYSVLYSAIRYRKLVRLQNGAKVILSESVTVNHLNIYGGGLLVFKDQLLNPIRLRAKSILLQGTFMSNPENPDDELGQLWIGSRTCRYQGEAEIVLYGNVTDMDDTWIGRKFLHASTQSVLEMHGKVKKSWTHLAEHVFANNLPYHPIKIDSDTDTAVPTAGIHVHRFSTAGDLKDIKAWTTINQGFDGVLEWFQEQDFNDDIILMFPSGLFCADDPIYSVVFFAMPDEFRSYMSNLFNVPEDTFGGTNSQSLQRYTPKNRMGQPQNVPEFKKIKKISKRFFRDTSPI